MPGPADADAPEDDSYRGDDPLPESDDYDENIRWQGDPLEDHFASREPVPAWPVIPASVPAPPSSTTAAAGATAGPTGPVKPPDGLLDLSLPWATLTCERPGPGKLGRIGPVTATQARHLARVASTDIRTRWRVILTDTDGRATAVGRIPKIRPPAGYDPPDTAPLISRVTITMPQTAVTSIPPGATDGGQIMAAILRAAIRARAAASQLAQADRDAPGGCAHTIATPAYRPPPRIREHVTARDLTCRYLSCGQPASRGDLDHTRPWDKGGLTCTCNLGGVCRSHHILKQHPGWTLTQPTPGVFQWVTPAGRVYTIHPDSHDT